MDCYTRLPLDSIRMKRLIFFFVTSFLLFCTNVLGWGFYAHTKINYYAVFLLPPEMMVLYKPYIQFIQDHATDPDKRRYIMAAEAPRHYIDLDYYGTYPFHSLPHSWSQATERYCEDTIISNGMVPWHVLNMQQRLTNAFIKKDLLAILKTSAELGHYIADAHVPLHTSSNHNGQLTNQTGIHGFWESRVPELLAENEFEFMLGTASYISNPSDYIWNVVLESAKAVDSVLSMEALLTKKMGKGNKYSFENRNGIIVKQYASSFTKLYHQQLNNMVERRMQQSIFTVSSFWYTAWVNAGQPNLRELSSQIISSKDMEVLENLNKEWRLATQIIGREE